MDEEEEVIKSQFDPVLSGFMLKSNKYGMK
jgi:hypothetical protein